MFLLALIAGCTSMAGEVMELGRNRYTVTARLGGAFSEWEDVKKLALDKARAHCSAMGRQVEADNWKTTGKRPWTRLEVDLSFHCELP